MPYSNGNSFSEGNSFSNGHSMGITDRSREPWYIRLLRPIQDRRGM